MAHGNSAASAELTCMLGGICVGEGYRGRGYAKDIIRTLCREIHSQRIIPIQSSQNLDLRFMAGGAWPSLYNRGKKWERKN